MAINMDNNTWANVNVKWYILWICKLMTECCNCQSDIAIIASNPDMWYLFHAYYRIKYILCLQKSSEDLLLFTHIAENANLVHSNALKATYFIFFFSNLHFSMQKCELCKYLVVWNVFQALLMCYKLNDKAVIHLKRYYCHCLKSLGLQRRYQIFRGVCHVAKSQMCKRP